LNIFTWGSQKELHVRTPLLPAAFSPNALDLSVVFNASQFFEFDAAPASLSTTYIHNTNEQTLFATRAHETKILNLQRNSCQERFIFDTVSSVYCAFQGLSLHHAMQFLKVVRAKLRVRHILDVKLQLNTLNRGNFLQCLERDSRAMSRQCLTNVHC
jgi:hypothetical protein